jgi:hypothetical protein
MCRWRVRRRSFCPGDTDVTGDVRNPAAGHQATNHPKTPGGDNENTLTTYPSTPRTCSNAGSNKPIYQRTIRFVEKEFKTALRYEDLGPENLGCTIFNSSGAVEAILVSRSLEEQNTIPARRRVRSTVAHEAGHGLLHGSLFHGAVRENQRLILCRSEDILVDTQRSYTRA